MTLEEILNEYEKDSVISATKLTQESLDTPKLHHKYLRIFAHEKQTLSAYEAAYKILIKEKYEFLLQGETKETKEKGWELPPRGLILKGEVAMYLEADIDLNRILTKINLQKNKITVLSDILKVVIDRRYHISSAIKNRDFEHGIG